MTPNPRVRIDGQVRDITDIKVRVDGQLQPVTAGYVRDTDGLQQIYDEADETAPPYTLIDDFENGVSTNWTNDGNFSTTAGSSFSGERSAYRSSGGSIRAGADDFDAGLQRGAPFVCVGVYSGDGTGRTEINFGRETTGDNHDGYSATIDWDTQRLKLQWREGTTTWTDIATDDGNIVADTWYDVVVYWSSEDTLHAWVYDGSDMIAKAEVAGLGRTGDVWAIWPSTTGESGLLLDFIRSSEEHPYTGDHYTAISTDVPEPDIDSKYEGADEVITADYDSMSEPEEFYRLGQVTNWNWSTATVSSGSRSLEVPWKAGDDKGANAFWYDLPERGHGQQLEIYNRAMIYIGEEFNNETDSPRIWTTAYNNEAGTGAWEYRPDGYNGWADRPGIAPNRSSAGDGEATLYSYVAHVDQQYDWSDTIYLDATVPIGEWFEFATYCRVNSVSGGTGNRDGVLRYFVDGTEVWSRDDFCWTHTHEYNTIQYTGMHCMYGGGNSADLDQSIYYDDHEIVLGWEP